jgi:hypothetical protein
MYGACMYLHTEYIPSSSFLLAGPVWKGGKINDLPPDLGKQGCTSSACLWIQILRTTSVRTYLAHMDVQG